MIESSIEVEQQSIASANNAAVFTSTPMSVRESGGEETKIPQQVKNKCHCFCPVLAAEHGTEAAVIFQGLGYKIAKSKKIHEGRKWHYDTLKALEDRWPYLSDSGIGGILTREAADGAVYKGNFNKWGLDQTCWYSMRDDLLERAMVDGGKLWFDVQAAVKCRSIIAGTLYHNLRYHLLLLLADHPDHEGVPYHRVNKAALARFLPWSLSTIKREFDELIKAGLIARNPKCDREYTICDLADLVVPVEMQNHASKSGSSTDKNGSSAEMRIVSSMEMTGSSTDKSVSSTDEIGSSAENNTHYKPLGKHIHKHHSPTAAPSVRSACESAADAVGKVHDDIGHEHCSAPVPGKENGWISAPLTLDKIRSRISTLASCISEAEHATVSKEALGLSKFFVGEELEYNTVKKASSTQTPDDIIPLIESDLRRLFSEHGEGSGWTAEASELAFLWALEIVTGVLLLEARGDANLHCKLGHWSSDIEEIHRVHMPDFYRRTDIPADAKAAVFVGMIRLHNQDGWPTYAKGDVWFTVDPSASAESCAGRFFEENDNLSAHDAWAVLSDCVEVKMLETRYAGEGKFDSLWHARRGVEPTFLIRHWEKINAELDAARPLAQ